MATETWVLNDEINQYTGETTGGFGRGLNYISTEFTTNSYNVKSLIIDNFGNFTSTGSWVIGIQGNAVPTSASDTLYMYENGGGWTNTAFKTWVFETAPTGDLLTWLQANGTKQATPRLSVDVSTLPGWANLSAGEKSITVVAKANGYKDSAPSAAVQVTKAAAGHKVTIKFINGGFTSVSYVRDLVFYSLDDGQTWIDPLASATTWEDVILTNVKQIKLKCTSTNLDYSYAQNGTGSLQNVNLNTYSGSTDTSSNISITEDSSITFSFGD